MAMPVVALCALGLLSLVGVVRDALLAEDLARLGARLAATDPSDTRVASAVADAAGDEVVTEVTIDPSLRHHGDTVVVTVTVHRPDRRFDLTLTGRAAVHGEPLLDRPAGPARVGP